MTYRRLACLTLTLALAGGLSNALAQTAGEDAQEGENDAPTLLQPGTEGEGSGGTPSGGAQSGGAASGGAASGGTESGGGQPPAVKPASAATLPDGVEREVLVEGMQEPMTLAVADDGRVFYVERLGNVKMWSEEAGLQDVHTFDVYTEEEHGLMGIALDPEFGSNNHIYVYYTPAQGEGNRLARFTYSDEGGEPSLDVESEEVLLEVPSARDTCCHQAGDIEFGPDGKLYLSTGDNTNPFESDGYAPIDRREGRAYFNALRTSGNLSDLRGKILRLNKDGSIPDDNPFVGTPDARPEIYALGFRNPFRFIVDPETGWLLVGNVGPDAEEPAPERGPAGYDEWHVITQPGQDAGWPTCIGDNTPYENWNFATNTSQGTFDCSGKTPAVVWYPYGPSDEFPEVDEGEVTEGRRGRNAQGGPILRNLEGAEYTWSEDYTDKWLIYEWQRNFIKLATLNEGGTEVVEIEPFISDLVRPMDLKQGPDGALYLLEYGTNWFTPNEDARLSRITSTQD